MSVVKKLHREFKEFTVHIEDWEILDEGFTVLWGPSGAGKTTILNALVGADPKAHLSWRVHDRDLGTLPMGARQLGVVFQDLGLFPHMSAQQNILFPVNKTKHENWQQDFETLVAGLQLSECVQRSVQSLSGGERQRVAIARALIYRPRMLLLDEPFSSLDEELRQSSRQMIQKLCAQLHCPVLLITHDRTDVDVLADKVTQISRGAIVRDSLTL